MNRTEFRALFRTDGVVVLPVIHVLDAKQALRNMDVAIEAGAPGCLLINHDFGVEAFLPILREARSSRPDVWLGVNFLAVTGRDAFPTLGVLAEEGLPLQAYWADDARIDEIGGAQPEADEISAVREASGWRGLYCGGTAFKKQRPVAPEHYEEAARRASGFMDVVTTSGVATGEAADADKINAFRRGVGGGALGLASGVTPDNATRYAAVDCFMVATGVNVPGDFYTLDAARLRALLDVAASLTTDDASGALSL